MSVIQRIRRGVKDEHWTIRIRVDGKPRSIATPYTSRKLAEQAEASLRAETRTEDFQERLSGLQRRHSQTVGDLLTAYRAAGCPDRRGTARPARQRATEERHIDLLTVWWSAKSAHGVTVADCADYLEHRRATVTRGTGERTTELELVTLSNCFTWSVNRRLLKTNPISERGNFRRAGDVRHCRVVKPESGDELHRLAGALLADARSASTGFLCLFEALTGLRTSEALRLRWDAQRQGDQHAPGYIDDRAIYYSLSKQRQGNQVIRAILLNDPLRPHTAKLIEAMRNWHARRHPESPWFFPGRDPRQPLNASTLDHALADAAAVLGLPARNPHGLRAYYCTARRCQGIPDEQIAYEMGHANADAKLVRSVYGDPPANWQGLANTFTFIPSTAAVPCAWHPWLPISAETLHAVIG